MNTKPCAPGCNVMRRESGRSVYGDRGASEENVIRKTAAAEHRVFDRIMANSPLSKRAIDNIRKYA